MSKYCPECERIMKPTLISIENKKEIRLKCRYCNIIDGLEKQIRIDIRNAIPKKCPTCYKENIKFESINDKKEIYWECKDCNAIFLWKKYIAIFGVEVKFESTPEDARDYASEVMDYGEVTLMGYWEDGKYDAHLRFSKKKREGEINPKSSTLMIGIEV